MLCSGFDSAVADRAIWLRRPRGPALDLAILLELARLRPRELTVVVDGDVRTLPVTLVAVGDTACHGAGMRVCPAADPGDGRLGVTVVGPISRRDRSAPVPDWSTARTSPTRP